MNTPVRIAGAVLLALAVCAVPFLDGRRAPRILRPPEASAFVGGAPPCALKVINTTDTCNLRQQDVGGIGYRCTGSNADQVCQGADTNTNNVCGKSQATCGGDQQQWNGTTGTWVTTGTCMVCTYNTAYLEAGTCTPASP